MKILALLAASAALLLILDQYHPASAPTTVVRPLSGVTAPAAPVAPPAAASCGCRPDLDSGRLRSFLDCETAEHVDLMRYVYAAALQSQTIDTKPHLEQRMGHVSGLLAAVRTQPCREPAMCAHIIEALTEHWAACDNILALVAQHSGHIP